MFYLRKHIFTVLTIVFAFYVIPAESFSQVKKGKIVIDKNRGHELKQGSSGFNVRIADKVWNYSHPEFRKAVHTLKPGWLRYFSGTMGDAFSSATGQYDKDYAWMFDKQGQYFRGYAFTDVKGPHRIIDLYELLGEVGGRLIVTINGFSETPEVAGELARFCKNNNIEVEVWQFCNEPYFYVPHRDRYWWNDGYDYARKMRPYAEAIREVFPDARLALNFTWDGIWGFMKEIYEYQQKEGAYWDVFSKHSYAPHIGGKESFENAYKRANSKIIEATSPSAMEQIENYTWDDIPMIITEFGVWNRPLWGIYSAIYYVEYTMRQLEHTNSEFIGSHEISNKYVPERNLNQVVLDAYREGKSIDTDTLQTGGELNNRDGARGIKIMHEATNNSRYTWNTRIEGAALVEGLKNEKVPGVYARAFKGINGQHYLVLTNRSGQMHHFDIEFGEERLNTEMERTYISTDIPKTQDFEIMEDVVTSSPLEIPSYSVVLVKWDAREKVSPSKTRVYKTDVVENGVKLQWWEREGATQYDVYTGTSPQKLEKVASLEAQNGNSYVLNNLEEGINYFFAVEAVNENGKSGLSKPVSISFQEPSRPEIFDVARRDTTITVMWQSVPDATGYMVKIVSEDGTEKKYDVKNVFGYRVSGLEYDQPYQISVSAYNGRGNSEYSESREMTCKEHLPLPPRNISAKETKEGYVSLQWVHQDTINPNVRYKLYKGTNVRNLELFKEDIHGNNYLDREVEKGTDYFYTVKSYNEDGECNFHPNIATVIGNDELVDIEIENVERADGYYRIKVSFSNIKNDGNVEYGVAISDISYLNVEEEIFDASVVSDGSFVVKVPVDELKSGRTYAIRGRIVTNGSPIYSLPPHENVKVE